MTYRNYIGGSDAGAVLGVSPYQSRLGLWERLMGMREPEPENERMKWGKRLEGPIIAAFAEETGWEVEHFPTYDPADEDGAVTFVHPEYPWLRSHPDGRVLSDDGGLIQAKVTHHLTDEWGEPGSSDVPATIYAQCQHDMVACVEHVTYVPVLVGGNTLHTFVVPADREFQDALVEQERDLWEAVKSGEPPEPDGSEDARRALRTLYPRAERDEIVATPELTEAMAAYITAHAISKAADADKELQAQRIIAYMGEHAHLAGDGYSAAYPNIKGSTSWALVAKAYRQMLEAIREPASKLDAIVSLHTAPESRRLTVKGTGE